MESTDLAGQQFDRTLGGGVEAVFFHFEQVGSHTHGGHRGTQFMTDVGHKSFLENACFLQLINLLVERISHRIEGLLQHTKLILTIHGNAHIEIAGGQCFRGRCHSFNRAHDATNHQPDYYAHHDGQQRTDDHQTELNLRQGLLLERVRINGEEFEVAGHAKVQYGAEHRCGRPAARHAGITGNFDRLIEHAVIQVGGHGRTDVIRNQTLIAGFGGYGDDGTRVGITTPQIHTYQVGGPLGLQRGRQVIDQLLDLHCGGDIGRVQTGLGLLHHV